MTKATNAVHIYAEDTLRFTKNNENTFDATKQLFKNFSYSISTSNENLKDYENLAFNIDVVRDEYPEMDLKSKIENKKAIVGVIGLGYVGLPLIRAFIAANSSSESTPRSRRSARRSSSASVVSSLDTFDELADVAG